MDPFGLIFADPPYGRGLGELALTSALKGGWVTRDAVVVLEEDAGAEVGEIEGLKRIDHRTYGDTQIVIFRVADTHP